MSIMCERALVAVYYLPGVHIYERVASISVGELVGESVAVATDTVVYQLEKAIDFY